jgi:hypothetical protein
MKLQTTVGLAVAVSLLATTLGGARVDQRSGSDRSDRERASAD